MDLSAGGLAPSSSRRTPGSTTRLPPGYTRFSSPTARPEVSYTISDTRTSTISTTRTVHLATPPQSQSQSGSKKGKGFALPQSRPLSSRVSPLDTQEKVFDSPGAEARFVELSDEPTDSSEEEMPPPRKSLAGRETGVANTPPVVESRIPRGARTSAGPSSERDKMALDEEGQNGGTMSSPGHANGSSDTEQNPPTPPSSRQVQAGEGKLDQPQSSSPGPSQPADDAALARPHPSQQRTNGHAHDQDPRSDEGYATSSTGPSSDPFAAQSDEIEFRDSEFDDSELPGSQNPRTVSKRPLDVINEESEGDQSGREGKKARRSASPELETPSSSQVEVEARLLDADRLTPLQRSQSVMSTVTDIHEEENQPEEEYQQMGDDEGEEEQPEQQAVVSADPLASIPSLYPTVKRPYFTHAQALAQKIKTEDDERASGDADAIQRWEEEKTKFGEQCLSLLKRVSDTLSKKAARHESFQAAVAAHSDKLASGLGQESEAFQTMVDRLCSLWQLSGMHGTMWRRLSDVANGGELRE